MTNKRFQVEVEDMVVSIKDNGSEIEYPFSLGVESIDDFDPVIQECLQVVGLLNNLHQENQELKKELKNKDKIIELYYKLVELND